MWKKYRIRKRKLHGERIKCINVYYNHTDCEHTEMWRMQNENIGAFITLQKILRGTFWKKR